jgi:hypothetical protein
VNIGTVRRMLGPGRRGFKAAFGTNGAALVGVGWNP